MNNTVSTETLWKWYREKESLCNDQEAQLSNLQKLCEDQRVEIAELKFVLMQRDAELTMRNDQLEKVRFQSDIYAKQVVLKEELINERSYQLATQTERVKSQDAEIEKLRAFADHILEGYSWVHDVDGGDAQEKAVELGLVELRPIDPEDSIDGETEHYFTKWTPKQALNQERLEEQS